MADFTDWTHEQVRQFVDAEQVFSAYQAARTELGQRFAGSMAWKTVRGRQYLYRKRKAAWSSLGLRCPETEAAHAAFHDGRARVKQRLADLARRLDAMAPVNRALGLGRMPVVAARALRALAAARLLGTGIRSSAPTRSSPMNAWPACASPAATSPPAISISCSTPVPA